ncbi:hypothetical protein [uncultured Tateyamaria sp.]|uniref:hypothetical protein n=1 Tax=uncultured Tateyamaria sp. TaxID=455651 RepID=UPI00262AA538|nr:hypothetical protein [uncultured Tateyamaria sp.]
MNMVRCCALFLFCASPLFGQTLLAPNSPEMFLKTFSVIAGFALPPWSSRESLTPGSSFTDSEVFQDQRYIGDDHEMGIWEMIPKGETFDNWTKLYAVTAENALTGNLDTYVQGQINYYTDICQTTVVRFPKKEPDIGAQFAIYCDSYKSDPDTGEVGFFNMQLKDETLVKNFYHIRMPSFDLSDPKKLPLNATEAWTAAAHVAVLELYPRSD